MRVVVDSDRCRGHGICWSLCPAVFQLNDDGYADVVVDEVPAEQRAAATEAVAQCPERAITAT